ncbi:hypothetical protein V8E53_006292 [Lactarius tabidus]
MTLADTVQMLHYKEVLGSALALVVSAFFDGAVLLICMGIQQYWIFPSFQKKTKFDRLVCTKCHATATQRSYDTAVSKDGVREGVPASPNEKEIVVVLPASVAKSSAVRKWRSQPRRISTKGNPMLPLRLTKKIGSSRVAPSTCRFVGPGPSPLGYHGAVDCPGVKVEKRTGLERDSWRGVLIPKCWTKRWTRNSEQEHEVVRSALGCKGTGDESIDEEYTWSVCRMLRGWSDFYGDDTRSERITFSQVPTIARNDSPRGFSYGKCGDFCRFDGAEKEEVSTVVVSLYRAVFLILRKQKQKINKHKYVRHWPTASALCQFELMSAEPPEDAKPKLNLVISLLEAHMFSLNDSEKILVHLSSYSALDKMRASVLTRLGTFGFVYDVSDCLQLIPLPSSAVGGGWRRD